MKIKRKGTCVYENISINGSPRKGNSVATINAFVGGASKKHEVEVVDAYQLKVSPCMGCGACQCYKGCVAKDDSNMIVDKMVAADMILFVSPVYWWELLLSLSLLLIKHTAKVHF